jgi:pimeloyl-ACP methyl ester carboxylesterase
MTTRFLNHAGGRLAYDDSGSGPLVLCAPSMGDLRAEYRFLSPLLVDRGYRVVTMDLRGHGESSTEWDDFSVAGVGSDMVALLRTLDGGRATIVGASMSAGAAVWAAAEAPDRVASLALIGPFVRGETTGANALLYKALFARPWGPAVWQWYYSTLYPTRKPADFAAYTGALRSNLAERGRLEALHRMLSASKSASEQRISKVKAPVMVLMGAKDPDFKDPAAEAKSVGDALHASLHLVEGGGHYPHAEMPQVVAPLLLAFLAEHQPLRETLYAA